MPRSRRVKLAATFLVLIGVVASPLTSTATTPANQFRFGWYDALENTWNPPIIGQAGMDMVTAYYGEGADPQVYLDEAQAAGLTVMAEIPEGYVKWMDVASIKALVARYKDHPALEGWHLADEPSVNKTVGPLSPGNAAALYDAIKSVDPVHPVSITFADGEDARQYLPALDILQHDDYPAKALTREFTNLDRWRKYTFWMSYVARQANKPFRPVLQGFGGTGGRSVLGYRAPTAREMRYMTYSAIAALSDDVYFWTFYRRDPNWVQSTLMPIVQQIRTMEPAISAGYRYGVAKSSNSAVTVTPVQDPGTGRWYLVTVNHAEANSATTLSFANELAGKSIAYRENGVPTTIVNDAFSTTLSPWEARVYTID